MKTKLIYYFIVISILLVTTGWEIYDYCPQESENEPVLDLMDAKSAPQVEKHVFVNGAALHGTNGMNFGPDGNLYIASVLGLEIIVMNTQTGKIINRIGREAGVTFPDDLVFGPDGSLYWTDIVIGNVGRMTPDGVVSKQFVAPGVNPITFSPDGRLFVGLCFFGDGLYELDPELVAPPRPIIEATPENPYPLGFLNAFNFGPDGRLYGPLFAAGMVVSVNVGEPGDLPSPSHFTDGTIQVVATGFTTPAAAKFAPNGQLIVLDQTGEVFSVNHLTGAKTVITTLQEGLDNLAFDSDGNLFVSNAAHGGIIKVLPDGQSRTISPGGMILPQGLAILPGPTGEDAVFLADYFMVRKFNGLTGNSEGNYAGSLVPIEGSLTVPMTVSADGNNLIVSSVGGAVQVWNPQLNRVLEHHNMNAPVNAIRLKDDIVVADLGLGGVVWASDNSMILPMDEVSVFLPLGLATDGEVLWVADWATGMVWQVSFDDKTPLTSVPVASGLANPKGLALDIDGSLLVVETGQSRLSRINLATGEVIHVVDGLDLSGPAVEGLPPNGFFDGVAVGSSGAIYISGGGANVLYRIYPR